MPEFEENTKNPDLNKDTNQYQPSQRKSDQKPSTEDSPRTTHPSNMRGRWKRSSRGPVKSNLPKKVEAQEILPSISETDDIVEESSVDEEESFAFKKEQASKPQQSHREKVTKPVDRKDVFIPKTKEESHRHKTRYPSMGRKKPSLWRKILIFFGLASKPKVRKHSHDTKDSSSTKTFSHKKKYPQSKKHPGQGPRGHYKHPSRKGPKSTS